MINFCVHNVVKKSTRIIAVTVLFMWVSGCANLEQLLPRYSDNRIQKVHVIAASNVNQSTPVEVDIVYVFEDALVAELTKYTARKWFSQKSQLENLYPKKFAIFNYELVPVSQATLVPKKQKSKFPYAHQKAAKVMMYINYLVESNDYTLDISPFKRPIINLGERKVTIIDKG